MFSPLRLQLKPIEVKVDKVVKEKTTKTEQKERMMEEARTDVETVKNKGQGVKTINLEIRAYLQGGKADQLESCFQRKDELKESQSERETEKKKLEVKINELREDVTRQDIKKRWEKLLIWLTLFISRRFKSTDFLFYYI